MEAILQAIYTLSSVLLNSSINSNVSGMFDSPMKTVLVSNQIKTYKQNVY